jgi:hypothetical protein
MKIHPVGAEFHAGRRKDGRTQTDRQDKANISLPQAPNNRFSVLQIMSHTKLQTSTVTKPADTNTVSPLVITV